MGNSHPYKTKDIDGSSQMGSPTSSPCGSLRLNKGMSRTASGADIQEKTITQLVPIEKLSKILQQKSFATYNVHGIMAEMFIRCVFRQQPELGGRFFKFLHTNSRAQTVHLGTTAFRQQCEKFLGLLDDNMILESYVKMYSDYNNSDYITTTGLRSLLMTSYNLAMFNYGGGSTKCPMLDRTLNAVVSSCYFGKDSLTIGYVSHWMEENCPRLIPTIHRYCVHLLSTSYRSINDEDHNVSEMATLGLELNTPILEKATPFDELDPPLLPLSEAWLLAGALPQIYSKPQPIQSPANSGTNLASQAFIAKMLSFVPSHWTLLYDSRQHGVGANRFLHHVLGYRGPTLVLLKSSNGQLFCLASVSEWKETHLYIGNTDSRLIQLLPKFCLLDKGEKILYLNTSIRGYPKGLRGGSDPKKPIISVDEHFEKIDYRGMSEQLLSIEVWGCGDKSSRDIQLDIKKWQIKEAERQRTVKLTAADWMDHPDRYLLELGGRTNYNNSAD